MENEIGMRHYLLYFILILSCFSCEKEASSHFIMAENECKETRLNGDQVKLCLENVQDSSCCIYCYCVWQGVATASFVLKANNQNILALQRLQAEQAAQMETARKDALRRAVSRQRANFGAQGTGSTGGSADAVLLGLFSESEEERAERERLDHLRGQADKIQDNNSYYMNLLSKTQDAEKKKIDNFYKYY